jgi:hypothetical protein
MAQLEEPAFHGDADSIYAYATYSTQETGIPVFIDQIVVDETSIACEVKTIREGRGKEKVISEVTEVSLTARVVLGGGVGDLIPDAWIDVMLATDGLNGPEFLDSFITTHGSESWANGWTVSTQLENPGAVFPLRLAVPYVYATDLANKTVYDPGSNNPGNGSVWTTVYDGPITAPYEFPYAITASFDVDCSK